MATTVRMPEVLANTTEAAIQSWSVAVGDTVAVGQPLAEIETDKAVVEYAAESAGTVLQLLVAEGDLVDVGSPIAVLGEPGEVATGDAAPATGSDAAATDPESAAPVADARPAFDDAAATQHDVADPAAAADGPPPERRFTSPLARRLAREHGIDVGDVHGTGPGGRIVRKDIEAMIASAPAPTPGAASAETGTAAAASGGPSSPERGTGAASTPERVDAELIPHSRMRRTIARRLVESTTQVPHFFLTAECRVDRLIELRSELNAAGTVRVSVNDLVVKAVAGALVDVPEANRTWTEEGMLQHRSVDVAIAVALDDGLVTPVVHGVEALSVSELGRRISDLAERARRGALRQHEIEGGSFSVSNLGMFGTREFSAIINPPHAGILAVGAARRAPVVVDDVLEIGTVMNVTLSADHRVLDGAVAARWLAAFVARIEHPLTILA